MNRQNLRRIPKLVDVDSDSKKNLSVSINSYDDNSYETKVVEIEKDIQV